MVIRSALLRLACESIDLELLSHHGPDGKQMQQLRLKRLALQRTSKTTSRALNPPHDNNESPNYKTKCYTFGGFFGQFPILIRVERWPGHGSRNMTRTGLGLGLHAFFSTMR